MIFLTTAEIVAAVRHSLADHVAAEMQTDFGRVQVAAALVALGEVEARLGGADPCAAESSRLTEGLRRLAGEIANELPAVAPAIEAAVRAAEAVTDLRERDRSLREELCRLVLDGDRRVVEHALKLAAENGAATAADDAAWVCREALTSLQ